MKYGNVPPGLLETNQFSHRLSDSSTPKLSRDPAPAAADTASPSSSQSRRKSNSLDHMRRTPCDARVGEQNVQMQAEHTQRLTTDTG
ncbi:hypothetical protein VTO73DRAFT_6767 [Trametes versicolor]